MTNGLVGGRRVVRWTARTTAQKQDQAQAVGPWVFLAKTDFSILVQPTDKRGLLDQFTSSRWISQDQVEAIIPPFD